MLINQIALISETRRIKFFEVAQITAALQKQITRDFTPLWNIPATIDAFQTLAEVPKGYWPIIIRDNIGFPGLAGFHSDCHGQPFALVDEKGVYTSLFCSHEMLEMLVDPFGYRFVASQSIKPGQGRVKYLAEICDPSQGAQFGYHINGLMVSDFYTPNYFDPIENPSVRYSYTGAITKPRQVLNGGYLTWMIDETSEWWQAVFSDSALEFRRIEVKFRKEERSWRELIDALTFEPLRKNVEERLVANTVFTTGATLEASSMTWASSLHSQIDKLQENHQHLSANSE